MTDNLSTFLSTFAGTLTSDASEVHGNALQMAISRLTEQEYAEAMTMVRNKVLELIKQVRLERGLEEAVSKESGCEINESSVAGVCHE